MRVAVGRPSDATKATDGLASDICAAAGEARESHAVEQCSSGFGWLTVELAAAPKRKEAQDP